MQHLLSFIRHYEKVLEFQLLEAMACGTPIITGNTSSMPEVAGPGALTIDPYKPEEIANALLCLETDNVLYQQQQNYGLDG